MKIQTVKTNTTSFRNLFTKIPKEQRAENMFKEYQTDKNVWKNTFIIGGFTAAIAGIILAKKKSPHIVFNSLEIASAIMFPTYLIQHIAQTFNKQKSITK